MGNVADKIGLLTRQRELAVQIVDDEPASRGNRQEQNRNEQTERKLKRARRLGQLGGIEQIHGDLPVRQDFTDFRRDKRPLPRRLKAGNRKRHRFGGIVQQGEADIALQGGFRRLKLRLKGRDETG